MTSLDAVTAWVTRYREAWESNDPANIGALFAEDGAYFPQPYAKPWLGREKIVAKWLKKADKIGTTTLDWHPLIVTPELAIIEATTTYVKKRQTFSCLWVLRLDQHGQARQFTEWWMQHPADKTDKKA
jgi:uncharacterized protein (TIGR02246 family)